MFRFRRLASQFWLAGGIVMAFAVIGVVFLSFEVNRNTDQSKWLDRVHRVAGQLKFLKRDYFRERIDFQNYIRGGSPRDLKLFKEDQKVFLATFQSIERNYQEYSFRQVHVDRIREAYYSWLKIARKSVGSRSRARVFANTEKDLSSQVLSRIQEAIDYHEDFISRRGTIQKKNIRRSLITMGVINFLVLVLFGYLLYRLHGSIARPIEVLRRGIEEYRGGKFETRVRVSSSNEIGFLQSSFNEMAESIETMVKDLRKLDALKTDFLSMISHELRTPLTSISGYLRLVLAGDAGKVGDKQKEFLDIADKNVERLKELINEILDVEKIESGRMDLARTDFDLVALLKECVDTFTVVAQAQGVDLKFFFEGERVIVNADRGRLHQVFSNLISNAVKYTDEGSVEIELIPHKYGITVNVKDTGQGMTEEEVGSLFEKFYRTRSAIYSKSHGTGLGLVIVKSLVEAHNGTISVVSTKGRGTVFTVNLPAGG